jgi:serine/threonine protein kinase
MVAKVADFGLSRSGKLGGSDRAIEHDESTGDYYRSRSGVFAVRWTAPEAMEELRFTQASDVWSFGIVLVEMFQDGVAPYGLWSTALVMTKVVGGLKHMQPAGCQDAVYAMMLQCWTTDATARPLFSRLVTMLENVCEPLHRERGCSGQGVLDVSPPGSSVRDTAGSGYEMPEGFGAADGPRSQRAPQQMPRSKRAPQQIEAHVDDRSSLRPSAALDQNGYVADTSALEQHQRHYAASGRAHVFALTSPPNVRLSRLHDVTPAPRSVDDRSSLRPSAALDQNGYGADASGLVQHQRHYTADGRVHTHIVGNMDRTARHKSLSGLDSVGTTMVNKAHVELEPNTLVEGGPISPQEFEFGNESSSIQTCTMATPTDTLLPLALPVATLSSLSASWEGGEDLDTIADADVDRKGIGLRSVRKASVYAGFNTVDGEAC